ncbi:MAG: hypothetical protein QOI32_63 [Thermoleophilaceae bacterium]|nr:hypothetical protein [Thermoleophilaceae bacterium]
MRHVNDGLRFLLELGMLASLAYWGFTDHDGAIQWLLGLGAPALVALVWGVFMSPKASHPTTDPARLALELVLFGSGVAALFAADQTTLAAILAALIALHLVLTFALSQRPRLGTIPHGGSSRIG